MKRHLIVTCVAAFNIGIGVGWFAERTLAPPDTSLWMEPQRYIYYSTNEGQLSIGIHPDGTSEIGPQYDRKTEAMKLLALVRAFHDKGVTPDCHETGYAPFDDGERRVYTGSAWPPSAPGGLVRTF